MSGNKTVSLVLGSGGARGLAHVGVIDQLTRDGFEIEAIAGSSMGALIGGIYAMGKLDVYTRWVTALERGDVVRLLDLSFGRNGLIKGDRIIEVLKSLIGDSDIEDLPIKFTAVATDIEDEKEVWFTNGSLFDAIRASIAIPTIFTPHPYRGKQFLDGSLINPVPIAPTLKDETDLTIAVNLSGMPEKNIKPTPTPPKDENHLMATYRYHIAQFIDDLKLRLGRQSEESLGLLDIIIKSMSIMEHTLAQAQLKTYSPDLVIEIPRNACNFYEFHRSQEMIEIGRQKTEAALSRYAGHTA
jgi:NTE family protein